MCVCVSLPPPPPPHHISFWWYILYIVSIFLVCFISSDLKLILPKLYCNTGTVNAPVAVILFLVFNLDFCIILKLLVYSFLLISYYATFFVQFCSFITFSRWSFLCCSLPVLLQTLHLSFSHDWIWSLSVVLVWINSGRVY